MLLWIAAFLSGIAASMGLGGGFVLLLYLTLAAGLPQLEAQWLNLFFFLPIGLLALVIHIKNGLVEKKAVLPAALSGLLGVFAGNFLSQFLGEGGLVRVFALFLFAVGLKELFKKKKD